MRRLGIGLAVVFLIGSVLIAGPASAEDVIGVIDGKRWTESGGPYRVTGPLVIEDLEIEEGTEVIVQGNFEITVSGNLEVNGEQGEPVIFTYKTETSDGWQGIRFAESQNNSDIQWAEISYARTGLSTNRQNWSVQNTYLHDNTVGVDLTGAPLGDDATGRFRSNYISDNDTGVRVLGRVATFDLNTITENETGVSFMTTSGIYSKNNILENSDEDATSCGMLGSGEIDATDNWWGTVDEDDIADAICDEDDEDGRPAIDFGGFELGPVPGSATLEEPLPSPSPSVSASPSSSPATNHSRTVTLSLRRHLRARGTVTVVDGFAGCMPFSVTISHKPVGGTWRAIQELSVDTATGSFAGRLKDRKGAYRASVPQSGSSSDVCLPASSPKVRHTHN